jgi:hypothetical protein
LPGGTLLEVVVVGGFVARSTQEAQVFERVVSTLRYRNDMMHLQPAPFTTALAASLRPPIDGFQYRERYASIDLLGGAAGLRWSIRIGFSKFDRSHAAARRGHQMPNVVSAARRRRAVPGGIQRIGDLASARVRLNLDWGAGRTGGGRKDFFRLLGLGRPDFKPCEATHILT